MKKMSTILLSAIASVSFGQIVINEVQPSTNTVELKNLSTTTSVDVAEYIWCSKSGFRYKPVNSGGVSLIAPGGISVFTVDYDFIVADDELGLYVNTSYASSDAIVDYVEWGSTGHGRSSVGVGAGTWTTGDFIPAVTGDEVIVYDGSGDQAGDYEVLPAASSTLGTENPILTGLISSNVEFLSSYPNPVTDRLFVTSDVQSYSVVNLVGETIQSGNYTTNGIDVSSLEKGAYVVQLTTSNGLAYSKFVK